MKNLPKVFILYVEINVTIQEIWSLFLSLHGFVSHYIGHVSSYEDVEGLAVSHADFLLKAIRIRFFLLIRFDKKIYFKLY